MSRSHLFNAHFHEIMATHCPFAKRSFSDADCVSSQLNCSVQLQFRFTLKSSSDSLNSASCLLRKGGSGGFSFQFSEEDKRATTNVQNGLVLIFLFSFILFYSLLFSFILFYSLLFSFIIFELKQQ